jgi:hypothetical protein
MPIAGSLALDGHGSIPIGRQVSSETSPAMSGLLRDYKTDR